jgi:single-strand DNA-binding protein
MPSTNIQILVGNIGNDLNVKKASNGRTVAMFSLATDDGYYDKENNEWCENLNWHNIVVFREGLAQRLAEKVRKGDMVLVQGRLEFSDYVDREGITRRSSDTIAERVQLLRSRNRE